MSRPWVEDLWRKRSGAPTSLDGKGRRWRVYWNEDDAGRPVRRSKRFRTKAEAQDFASEVESAQRAGTYISAEKGETLLKDAAAEWLENALDIKHSTRARYERELRSYTLPQWGHRALNSLTTREIQTWVTQLSAGTAMAVYLKRGESNDPLPPARRMNRPLSPNSIKHIVQGLSATMRWAINNELILRNPVSHVRLPRPTDTDRAYLTHTEVDRLADSAFDVTGRETDRTLVYFLAYTGLRINEALALQINMLDLTRGRLTVRQAWTIDRDKNQTLGTPKNGKRREVGIPGFLVTRLQALVAGLGPDDFVFQSVRGGPMNDHNWRTRVFNLAKDEAGLPLALTPHKLRHTAASLALAAGSDVKVLQNMLGHKSAAETLNTYADLLPDRVEEISTALDAARAAAIKPGA